MLNMLPIQFVFFDLDGTLLNDEKKIDRDCVAYLRELKTRYSVRFGFSTGRHEASISPFLEEYALESLLDGMVCNSGSDIYYFDPPEHIEFNYLPVETLEQILLAFDPFDFLTVAFHNGRRLIATGMNREVQTVLDRNAYYRFYRPEQIELQAAPKCLLLFDPDDRDKVAQAVKSVPLEGLRAIFTEPNICEILHESNSKSSGVGKLLERYGLSLRDVMMFGDAENDREIMETAGISVCMKNGDRDIQQLADFVTEKTNNENGIMDFLQKHEVCFGRKI